MANQTVKAEKSEISFEDSLLKLEEIVQKLEKGELPLEEAMNIYESGVSLTIELNHRLKGAKLKVEELKGQKDDT